MRVQDILRTKKAELVSISPDASILEAAAIITDKKVGMLLVINDDKELVGLLSERDIVSYIATRDDNAVASRVEAAMTGIGLIAKPDDSVAGMMREMTNRRARHAPVVSDRRLVGVISIGDILNSRLVEKDQEAAVLRDIAQVSLVAATWTAQK